MSETVMIVDSGPLIALARIKQLDLLRLLSTQILAPSGVWNEVTVYGRGAPGAEEVRQLPGATYKRPTHISLNL